jgi:diketogulonate reductase-like aldo/keto reductase
MNQKHIRKTCKEANIHVSAWAPLGAPKQKWGSDDLLRDLIIKDISLKHGKTPAQVLIKGLFLPQRVSTLTRGQKEPNNSYYPFVCLVEKSDWLRKIYVIH